MEAKRTGAFTETAPDSLLSTGDVAKRAGVTSEAVRAWHRRGKLEAVRTEGGLRLFRRDDVEAFLERRREGGQG